MPDSIIEHYEKHSAGYDAERRKSFHERSWLERFVQPLPRDGSILDLGCGAGEPIDRYLIDKGFNITGVDGSPRMITLARTRFPRQRWLTGDMRKVIMDGRYDGVLVWDALFHLPGPDQIDMIRRIAGWLKPNGRLLFNTTPDAALLASAPRGVTLYNESLDAAEYRAAFEVFKLVEIAYHPDEANSGGRSIWFVRKPS